MSKKNTTSKPAEATPGDASARSAAFTKNGAGLKVASSSPGEPAADASTPLDMHEALSIEQWPIDRPVPFPKNARKWSDRAIATLASSIKEYGFRQPIVVDPEGVIVIGHLRLAAAKSLGLAQVPVHVARDLSPLQIRGLRIADNRTAQEATFDFDLLGPELADLQALNFDLNLTGFEDDEINELLIQAGLSEGLTDEDEVPEAPVEPVTKPGDLWLLGAYVECPHCGAQNDV
jgi:hypothetical protein